MAAESTLTTKAMIAKTIRTLEPETEKMAAGVMTYKERKAAPRKCLGHFIPKSQIGEREKKEGRKKERTMNEAKF